MAVDSPALLNGVSVEDRHFRQLARMALGGSPLAFAGGVGADNRGAHGVGGFDHLVVTQSASPGMSVDVSAGIAAITGTQSVNQGPFPFWNNAPGTLTIAAAHATQARRDLVIAQIPTDGSPPRLDRVTGTPHPTTPVDPSLATYPNALVLARVRVAGGASSILNAAIDDLRTYAGIYASQIAMQAWVAARLPKQYRATGGAHTTSGAGAIHVCTLDVPAQPVAGKVSVQSFTRLTKTVAGDVFIGELWAFSAPSGTVELAGHRRSPSAETEMSWAASGSVDLPASTAMSIGMRLYRAAGGSGTATTLATYPTNHIDALWTAA